MRFDELELEPVVFDHAAPVAETAAAPWYRRLLALLTDLSLFAALSLALSPLLPAGREWIPAAALAGFVLVVSYYYFVGAWLLWGKTVGGAIFDVRVIAAETAAMALRNATLRWTAMLLSLFTGGLAFLFRLPDRMSGTRSVRA
jgi:uncharacterized RDD family membrane protein YckC